MSTHENPGGQQPPAQPPAAAQPPAPEQPAPDRQAESERVARLESQLAALTAKMEQQPGVAAGPALPPSAKFVPEPPAQLPDFAHEWPEHGGLKLPDSDDPAPQPWDLRAQGLSVTNEAPRPDGSPGATVIVAPHSGDVVQIAPGDADHVSPIVVAHGRPILGPLMADPSVIELGQLLGKLGIANSVSEGRNPNGVYDESLQNAVQRFRIAYGVEEDPSQWPLDPERGARLHCGPWTWEAILRVAARVDAEAEQDGRVLTHARS